MPGLHRNILEIRGLKCEWIVPMQCNIVYLHKIKTNVGTIQRWIIIQFLVQMNDFVKLTMEQKYH